MYFYDTRNSTFDLLSYFISPYYAKLNQYLVGIKLRFKNFITILEKDTSVYLM